jgi:hypothetical protein
MYDVCVCVCVCACVCVCVCVYHLIKTHANRRGSDSRESGERDRDAGGEECAHLKAIVNADVKLAVVPTVLINYMTRKLVWHGLKAFRQKAVRVACSV